MQIHGLRGNLAWAAGALQGAFETATESEVSASTRADERLRCAANERPTPRIGGFGMSVHRAAPGSEGYDGRLAQINLAGLPNSRRGMSSLSPRESAPSGGWGQHPAAPDGASPGVRDKGT